MRSLIMVSGSIGSSRYCILLDQDLQLRFMVMFEEIEKYWGIEKATRQGATSA